MLKLFILLLLICEVFTSMKISNHLREEKNPASGSLKTQFSSSSHIDEHYDHAVNAKKLRNDNSNVEDKFKQDENQHHEQRILIPGTSSTIINNLYPNVIGSGIIANLSETLNFTPVRGSPGVTDPPAMPAGSGSPSQQFSAPPVNPLLASIKTEAIGVTQIGNFAAKDSSQVNGGGWLMPPDNNLCSGNNQIALLVNSALRVYDTAGNILKTTSFASIFGVTKPRTSLFDPVCVFDSNPLVNRWVIVVDYLETDANNVLLASGLYILVSNGKDLVNGGYYYYYVEYISTCNNGADCFVDYPTIGMDKYGIWISTNNFDWNGGFVGSRMISLPKAIIYNHATLDFCIWDDLKCSGNQVFTVQPAKVPFGATPTNSFQYAITNYGSTSVCKFTFAATKFLSSGTCAKIKMSNTIVSGFTTATMSNPPNFVTQKNGVQIDADDGRMSQVILSGKGSSTLFFSRTIATGDGTTSGLVVYAINKDTNVIKFQGVVAFAGWSVWNSAMTVNKNGYGVIVSTALPPVNILNTITTLVTPFQLVNDVGSIVLGIYDPNTNHLCGYTTPYLRTGDYSGADINSDGTAFVVSMNADSDTCPSPVLTNWRCTVKKVTLV